MNNEKTENDRFYDPSNEAPEVQAGLIYDMTKGEFRHLQGPTEHMCCGVTQTHMPPPTSGLDVEPANNSDNCHALTFMEYAPEPQNMIEAKSAGLKFTVGNKYPVFEKKEHYYVASASQINKFRTISDSGVSMWVDEKYFIANHEPKLLWNDWEPLASSGIGFNCTPSTKFVKEDYFGTLDENVVSGDGYVEAIDIRKVAKEKNISLTEEQLNDFDFELHKKLSGMATEESLASPEDEKEPEDEPYTKYSWEYTTIEGTVKDTGNPLLFDADKCLAAVSKVFGKGDIVDPDDLILSIKRNTNSLVTWKEGFLAVEGVKTKIAYAEAQEAYKGLQSITSTKIAKKIVGKLLSDKIKTLF